MRNMILIGISISLFHFVGADRSIAHVATSQAVQSATPVQNSQVIAEIEDHLNHANVPKHGRVQVTFAQGVATLTGTVDSVGVKTDAERAVWKDEDVRRVVNQIGVASTGTDSTQIVNEARRKILTHYANTIFDNIEIEVQGNTLVLLGKVTQPYKKEAAGYFLAHIKGVVALENKIQVLPLSVDDEDLRMRIARAIYDDPDLASYAEMANPSIHIVVSDGKVTLVGTVNSELDRSRAEQDARLVSAFSEVKNALRLQGQGTSQ
jgi:osmotically-inducible protein OsmY